METIPTATKAQIAKLIDAAVRDVASWPLWKANPEVIKGAQRYIKEQDT